jgi:hypothetical protein
MLNNTTVKQLKSRGRPRAAGIQERFEPSPTAEGGEKFFKAFFTTK